MAKIVSLTDKFTTSLIFLTFVYNSFGLKSCSSVPGDPCSCKTDEGKINLWSLANRDGTARFKDIPSGGTGGGTFSWNPCMPFTEQSDNNCKNVAACHSTSYGGFVPVGEQNTAKCELNKDKSNCDLTYTDKGILTSLPNKLFIVNLVCSDVSNSKPGTVDINTQDSKQTVYKMTLSSNCACPGKCGGEVSSSLSNGTILCIIFAVLLILYLAVGMTFNGVQKGAKGLELVPNRSLWADLPFLVKDGCVFFCSSVKNLCQRASGSYNQI